MSRETLRIIAASDLGQVAGGGTLTLSALCTATDPKPRSNAWSGTNLDQYCN